MPLQLQKPLDFCISVSPVLSTLPGIKELLSVHLSSDQIVGHLKGQLVYLSILSCSNFFPCPIASSPNEAT